MNEVVVAQQNNIVSLANWNELLSRAEYLAKSELIPAALRGKPSSVAVILQIGCELGISPLQALNGISVIQGKPGVDPQLAIALIRQRIPGAVIKFKCDESKAEVTMARSKETIDEAYTAVWNMDKAKRMGLASKENYLKQPGTMLRWRAVMEAARAVFPDVIKGMYSGEELDGVPSDEPAVDKGAVIAAELAKATETQAKVEAKVEELKAQAQAIPAEFRKVEPATTGTSDEALPPGATSEGPLDPVADYEFTVGQGMVGKRMKDFPPAFLKKWRVDVEAWFGREKRSIKGPWLEALMRIDEYTARFEAKQPIIEPEIVESVPSFDDFKPGE